LIKSINDLIVYKKSYELAMAIFELTKKFPPEEKYSLTGQIRRSSRSVAGNIREGFGKRRYPQVFVRHLNDSLGSSEETRGWLSFSKDCGYIAAEEFNALDSSYDEINAMLHSLMNKWEKYEVQEAEMEYEF
jgi:four helix bundle protein